MVASLDVFIFIFKKLITYMRGLVWRPMVRRRESGRIQVRAS